MYTHTVHTHTRCMHTHFNAYQACTHILTQIVCIYTQSCTHTHVDTHNLYTQLPSLSFIIRHVHAYTHINLTLFNRPKAGSPQTNDQYFIMRSNTMYSISNANT